jgi:hypothetical protein
MNLKQIGSNMTEIEVGDKSVLDHLLDGVK